MVPTRFARSLGAVAVGCLLTLCLPIEASAQSAARSFDELQVRVKIGDTIYLTDSSGVETRGQLAKLSDVSLSLAHDGTRKDFAEGEVKRIDQRRRDSVWNGLLIGAGTGALIGFLRGRAADSPSCPRSGIECGQGALLGTVGGALWGGAGGWVADALNRRREVIYLAQGPDQEE